MQTKIDLPRCFAVTVLVQYDFPSHVEKVGLSVSDNQGCILPYDCRIIPWIFHRLHPDIVAQHTVSDSLYVVDDGNRVIARQEEVRMKRLDHVKKQWLDFGTGEDTLGTHIGFSYMDGVFLGDGVCCSD